MSQIALSSPEQSSPPAITLGAAVVLAVWFIAIVMLGVAGRFVGPPGSPPVQIAAGFMGPVAIFLLLYWRSLAFREWILAADLRTIMAMQAWRFAGFGFLALYAHHILPGHFALPAGLGDIAIGVTAPLMLIALLKRPDFASSRTFVFWNLLGILDLFVAVGSGGLDAFLATGAAGEISTTPMAQLPLLLIPVYFVPIFLMLHIAALLQARNWRKTH
ncbi:hypothetical protein [Silvimonas sp.]|uniref:hypothetical protein n=1 Tax=Silvimonas sp. TaxID=2650811 RepID=UPI002849D1E4|nr:hypothetical protein [Silvimonas sp.]MDR3427223.1 hypothetical protein [Silvimonas sp.]